MTGYLNIVPTAESDGVTYGTNVPLTSTEADLGDGIKSPDPIPVPPGHTIVAFVTLTVNGLIVGSNSYVVLQTDMGDNNWVDVAWNTWTGNQGSATFSLSGGGLGAENNAFQQTRQPGGFPSSFGSNVVPLGGRCRLVGKATAVGGSSSIFGTIAGITATTKYKIHSPE